MMLLMWWGSLQPALGFSPEDFGCGSPRCGAGPRPAAGSQPAILLATMLRRNSIIFHTPQCAANGHLRYRRIAD